MNTVTRRRQRKQIRWPKEEIPQLRQLRLPQLSSRGYKGNSYQENDRRSSGYRRYGKEDYGSSKKFQTKEPREYNPSPEDMLNGPCHIHSAFIDGKRVSRHAMKDCTTFLKLQEAAMSKQAEAKRQGYEGNTNNVPTSQ
jgi:hypothetical protein